MSSFDLTFFYHPVKHIQVPALHPSPASRCQPPRGPRKPHRAAPDLALPHIALSHLASPLPMPERDYLCPHATTKARTPLKPARDHSSFTVTLSVCFDRDLSFTRFGVLTCISLFPFLTSSHISPLTPSPFFPLSPPLPVPRLLPCLPSLPSGIPPQELRVQLPVSGITLPLPFPSKGSFPVISHHSSQSLTRT